MMLRDYVSRWLTIRQGRFSENTYRLYRYYLVKFVLPELGDVELQALTTPRIRTMLETYIERGRKQTAVHMMYTSLSSVLMDGVLAGLLATNVAHGATRRLWPPRTPAPKAMAQHELAALLEASRRVGPGWATDFFTLGARTGLRLGELLALHAGSLVSDPVSLRIARSYRGAGRFGPPKNGRVRVVDISSDTQALVSRRSHHAGASGYLFASPRRPDQPYAPCTVDHAFAQAVALAQLNPHYTVHSLRHTYASLLLVHGAPPQHVQQQMGHANYSITVDLYGSWFRSHRPDLITLLDAVAPQRPR